MVTHRPQLTTGEIYHVFNRTIANEPVFQSYDFLQRFINLIDYYRFDQSLRFSVFNKLQETEKSNYLKESSKIQPLIDIFAFSLMPNHYHFQLKQLQNNGVSKFLSNVQNSYAKYHNLKNDRTGGLFQSSFKSKLIITEEQFIHINRYIHLNPVTSYLIEFEELEIDSRSSFSWYLNRRINRFINVEPILKHFKIMKKYVKFVENQVDYQRKLNKIKNLMID